MKFLENFWTRELPSRKLFTLQKSKISTIDF